MTTEHEAARDALTDAIQRAHNEARAIAPVRGDANQGAVGQLRGLLDAIAAKAPAGLAAAEALDGKETRDDTADAVAMVFARAAAVAHAAGDGPAFDEWLSFAARQAKDPGVLAELGAAREHPDAYCKLVHGRYLFARGKERAARKEWRQLGKRADLRSMKKLVEHEENAPRALKNGQTPGLWRINGCGVGFYGRRDRWSDGTYATTHCICLVFVPLIPLSAYRVLDRDGGYVILAREQLSKFARLARLAVLGTVALLIAISIAKSYLNDPSRLATQRVESELAEARTLAKKTPEAALQRLLAVPESDLELAGAKNGDALGAEVMRLTASFIARPFTRDKLEQAGRMVERCNRLPFSAKTGGRTIVTAALDGYLADLGDAPAESDVRLQLLHHYAGLYGSFGNNVPADLLARISKEVMITVGAQQAEWPLEAFELLMEQPELTAEMLVAADALVQRLSAQPMLLADAGAAFDRWAKEADPAAKPAVKQAMSELREQADEAEKAVTGGKLEKPQLEAALKAQPWNQAALAQLAGQAASTGKLDEAEARLRSIGAPGLMSRRPRLLLGQLLAAAGKLDEADAVLSSLVNPRLPRFNSALTKLEAAEKAAFDRAESTLRTSPPADLRASYEGLASNEAEQRDLVNRWISNYVRGDVATMEAQRAYEGLADIVPASLELGTVKLRRAQELPEGAGRGAMLVAAERAFLGIRAAAEGQDEFQLGLGEIYARLGKAKESEEAFAALLGKNKPSLSLQVASLYRTIGNYERAKVVALAVFENGAASPEEKSRAAITLSLIEQMVSEERASEWLHKADPQDSYVRTALLEDEARQLFKDGKRAAAAAAYEKAAAAWLSQASARNSAAYNNAAIAQQNRYMCNGDLDALADGEAAMEKAYRIAGDNALVVGNLSQTLLRNAERRALGKRINLRALPLQDSEARALVQALLYSQDGKEAQGLRSALAASPALRRGEQMLATYAVLAPGSAEGYSRSLRQAMLFRDEAAAARVVASARAAKGIDTSTNDRSTQDWLKGVNDASMLASYHNEMQAMGSIAADSKLDARTRAAAYFLIVRNSATTGPVLDGSLEDAHRAVAAAEEAAKLWPALDVSSYAANALIDEAGLTSDAATWRKLRRTGTSVAVLDRLKREGSPLAAAVMSSPQWSQVVAHARADQRKPDVDDLRLARLIGDAALEQRAKAVLDDKLTRLDLELDLIITPSIPWTKENLEYLDRR